MVKKMAFFAQTTASFWKKIHDNIGFWENCQKSQKIVIITYTADPTNPDGSFLNPNDCSMGAKFQPTHLYNFPLEPILFKAKQNLRKLRPIWSPWLLDRYIKVQQHAPKLDWTSVRFPGTGRFKFHPVSETAFKRFFFSSISLLKIGRANHTCTGSATQLTSNVMTVQGDQTSLWKKIAQNVHSTTHLR
jgi:hypothetical protein